MTAQRGDFGMFASGGTSRSFTARFPGICENCGDGFEKGDDVMYDGDDLVHADPDDCVQLASTRSSDKVCGKCFLVHAGDCF